MLVLLTNYNQFLHVRNSVSKIIEIVIITKTGSRIKILSHFTVQITVVQPLSLQILLQKKKKM